MISVVVPAHDEGAVIGRCLEALLADAEPGEVEVVVACNGCTDRTAAVAAAHGPAVRVVSTPVASKPAALNLGDATATGFPRVYVDADVELPTAALRAVAAALGPGGGLLAAAPGLRLETAGASWAVRAYSRVWARLPSVRDDLVGRGVYAVSAEGRRRFGAFPDVLADDHFVRAAFGPSERGVVAGCASTVRTPATLRALVRRRVRVVAGNREHDRRRVGAPTGAVRGGGLGRVLREDPARVVDVPVFLAVGLAARLLAAWATRRGRTPSWGRDDTARR